MKTFLTIALLLVASTVYASDICILVPEYCAERDAELNRQIRENEIRQRELMQLMDMNSRILNSYPVPTSCQTYRLGNQIFTDCR